MTSHALRKHFRHREGQNEVKVIQGHQVQFFKKFILTSHALGKHFRHQGRSRSSKFIKCNFSKSLFLTSHAQKKDFQHQGNQIKVIQGQQVQFFKKCIFDLPCIENAFLTPQKVKIKSSSYKVIKCKFSKRVFLTSHH